MSWTNRILLALFLAGVAAYWPKEDISIRSDIGRAEQELERMRQDNQRLSYEIRNIEAEIAAFSLDSDSPQRVDARKRELARIARDDLNMIRPGEVVFEFHNQGQP